MKLITIIFCAFFSGKDSADTIIVHKDPRLDIFTEKQSAVNKLTSKMTSSGLYKGYRLQILSTRSRDEAFKLKTELLQMFPNHQTYILFQSPYFKVRIGNYFRRSDAESFKNRFLQKLSRNVYIVEDAIEYTPGEDEGTSN
jgi:sporulation related protein